VEGKIMAARYARENGIPFLGVCLGFQIAVIEFARNVLGYEDANSSEFVETEHPVIDLLPEQREIDMLGGTMRLGEEEVVLKEGSMAHTIYGTTRIYERHRHRYEVNPDYIEELESADLIFSGTDTTGRRMEVFELRGHPFYLGSQFHPEYKSRPMRPSPLHLALVKSAVEYSTRM
jgi:CTP synthase